MRYRNEDGYAFSKMIMRYQNESRATGIMIRRPRSLVPTRGRDRGRDSQRELIDPRPRESRSFAGSLFCRRCPVATVTQFSAAQWKEGANFGCARSQQYRSLLVLC